ncbi:MAG: hypothetical protein ACKVQK_04940 [Burkholderiales bacterium]
MNALGNKRAMSLWQWLAIISAAYAMGGFCQALYMFVIDPQGHGGGGIDFVVRYFLEVPIALVRHYFEFGFHQRDIIQGIIFLVMFFSVVSGALWWINRKHPVSPIPEETRVLKL